MACRETGECRLDPRICVDMLLTVTSGYRSPRHSIEAAKAKLGTPALGRAVDIECSEVGAFDILREVAESQHYPSRASNPFILMRCFNIT